MSKKIKKSIKIESDEAVIVAPVQDWVHVIALCQYTLDNAELTLDTKRGWKRVIDNLQQWLDQSMFAVPDEES